MRPSCVLWLGFYLILALNLKLAISAEWSKLKTCSDLGFCRRHRHFSAQEHQRYTVDSTSFQVASWQDLPALTVTLRSSAAPDLVLIIIAFAHGIFRVVVDDLEKPLHPRHLVPDVIVEEATPIPLSHSMLTVGEKDATVSHPSSPSSSRVKITYDPFQVHLLTSDQDTPQITINGRSTLRVESFTQPATPSAQVEISSEEHSATKSSDPQADSSASASDTPVETQEKTEETPAAHVCDGCGSEQFKEHSDPKLRGPESVGVDVSFPFASHLYGLPERTVSFALGDTLSHDGNVISEPLRLYNLDIFEFELDKPLGLYGSVPLLYARSGKQTVGMLWLNSAETFVDITTGPHGKSSHWFSETGHIDVYMLPGPSSLHVQDQYLFLTGTPAIPQKFALGYHQCRWNYNDDDDARGVDAEFDKQDIPYDVLWLDIEHTDGKRYFTWDKQRFPDPTALQEHIAARGRKMVTIIDPHVKRDKNYILHELGTSKDLYVKNPDGKPYDGWCWPGSSGYYDFTSPRVREIFGTMFSPSKYPHFSKNLYTWNDMNEPSVFNGPEGTMPKDRLHDGNVEHRHIHNIYGHYFMQATFEGLMKGHGGNDRPFVLSRSFFAGSQRFGAVWTGDNAANWEHLESSVRMLLPLQISGIVLSGADVGGFFGNPEPDLLTRWYQAGAFQPFFRGHAHLDTNRREPWLFGEPFTSIISTAIRTRYQFIPYWYTLLASSHFGSARSFSERSRGPPMRPLWWEFPEDEESNMNQKQWMVGNSLLVAPVLQKDATSHTLYLPTGEQWYDLFAPDGSGRLVHKSGHLEIPVTLERMVVMQRGGSIVPKQERRRRSTQAMSRDPYTLVIALNSERKAEGELYLDDGRSYDYKNGASTLRKFAFNGERLTAMTIVGSSQSFEEQTALVERVVILGYGKKAPRIAKARGKDLDFEHSSSTGVLTLQRLKLSVGVGNWDLTVGH